MTYFLPFLKPYRWQLIWSPLLKLLEALLELLVPMALSIIIDQVLPQHQPRLLWFWGAGLIGLATFNVLVALLAQYLAAKASVGFATALNQALFHHVTGLSVHQQQALGNSALLTRLTVDVLALQTGLNLFLRLVLRAPIIVFGAVVMAFFISPSLTIIYLSMVAGLFGLAYGLSRRVSATFLFLKQQQEKLFSVISEQLSGMRLIRAFHQIDREQADYSKHQETYTHETIKAANLANLINPGTYIIVNLSLLVLIYQGRQDIFGGQLSAGALVALVNYLLQILQELLKMMSLTASLSQAWVSGQRIRGLFLEEEENLHQTYPIDHQSVLGYELETVGLTYGSADYPVLSNLSLTLPLGQFVGIVGTTGAGKSSVVNLLAGLLPPSRGRISLRLSRSSAELTLAEWRQAVRLVPQKSRLLSGTIRSNLMLGLSAPVSDETLWQALDLAQAKTFVQALPEQLDAPVAPLGANFSGGQRQRLALARALVKPSPVLILDDATSALDYLTEMKVLSAIKAQFPDTLLVMVSQRLKNVMTADQILVLDKGQLVGQGTHQELLRSSAIYQNLYQSQLKGGGAND
ncbi:ABC transporter ATP-binding protein [Streptococcus entericus]|uniref:ABC transporter ATP-binding protein n=1 Tax=Streptococcus entericus TaxID=155680 RepID=UPI000372F606|nr:ABC transporter ATP-binding protein [Streptococcus entericus]